MVSMAPIPCVTARLRVVLNDIARSTGNIVQWPTDNEMQIMFDSLVVDLEWLDGDLVVVNGHECAYLRPNVNELFKARFINETDGYRFVIDSDDAGRCLRWLSSLGITLDGPGVKDPFHFLNPGRDTPVVPPISGSAPADDKASVDMEGDQLDAAIDAALA